jgi:putative ABC transport system ATP-binding protein
LIDEISVSIRPGEFLAIVGPSGSGKSSLLRLLNRLDEPSAGTVYFQGVDYRQIPPSELRRRIGMVTQRPFLFPGTVYDNLCFGPRQRGQILSEGEATKLLAGVGLQGYLRRDVANLSGGEAQRVSLARTLANAPEVLLLDEPTSALDEASKLEVERLLAEVSRSRALTCVMVTHDVAQAARLATHVLVVDQGRMAKMGSVAEVLNA